MKRNVQGVYERLYAHWGGQKWWPAQSPFEVVVGAILTQNTAWTNVETAIDRLRRRGWLTSAALARAGRDELEDAVRPAGFYRQKAARLQALAQLIEATYGGDLQKLFAGELEESRRRLLTLAGIGPETADAMLLYAGGRPTFVVDAYTVRIFMRLGLLCGDEKYETVRQLFMSTLPADAVQFNEFHALIVRLAKECCRKRHPRCQLCPLKPLCRFGNAFSSAEPPVAR